MAQISVEVPDDLINYLVARGKTPTEFLQEQLLEMAESLVPSPEVVLKFQALAAQWRRETRHCSLMSDIVLNTAYQQIIGMGRPVVGLILQDLRQQPDHWFWALRAITGENPTQTDDRGRLPQMAAAWLAWGRRHGHLTCDLGLQ